MSRTKRALLLAALAVAASPAANAQQTIAFQSFEGGQTAASSFGLGELNDGQLINELDTNGDGVLTPADAAPGKFLPVDADDDGDFEFDAPFYQFQPTASLFDDTPTFVAPEGFQDLAVQYFGEEVGAQIASASLGFIGPAVASELGAFEPGLFVGNTPNPNGTGTGRVFDATDGSLPWTLSWVNTRITNDVLDAAVQEEEIAAEIALADSLPPGAPLPDLTFSRAPGFDQDSYIGSPTPPAIDNNELEDAREEVPLGLLKFIDDALGTNLVPQGIVVAADDAPFNAAANPETGVEPTVLVIDGGPQFNPSIPITPDDDSFGTDIVTPGAPLGTETGAGFYIDVILNEDTGNLQSFTTVQFLNGVTGEGADRYGVANSDSFGGTFGGNIDLDGNPDTPSGPFVPDGENVFFAEDPDGSLFLEFDPVDTTGFEDLQLQYSLVVNATTYEENDLVAVFVNGQEVFGPFEGSFEDREDVLETASFEEEFEQITVNLSEFDGETVQITFQFDSSAGSEDMAIDDIKLLGFAVDNSLLGDLDADGDVDGDDLDLLSAAEDGAPLNDQLDLNGDGTLGFGPTGSADAAVILDQLGTTFGDIDLDGDVDFDDVSILLSNFLLGTDPEPGLPQPLTPEVPTYTDGDLNGDGRITTADLSILDGALASQGSSSAASMSVTPEPASLALVGIVIAAASRTRRR